MAELHVQRKRKTSWWLWLIIILIIAAAVFYWYVNYYQGDKNLTGFNQSFISVGTASNLLI
jgi:hypothetical protein